MSQIRKLRWAWTRAGGIHGSFSLVQISTVTYISSCLIINSLSIIVMNLLLICLQFVFCHLPPHCLIPWKSPSKALTGTHWSGASTPRRRDITVCSSENRGVNTAHWLLSLRALRAWGRVYSNGNWHSLNFVSTTPLLCFFWFYFKWRLSGNFLWEWKIFFCLIDHNSVWNVQREPVISSLLPSLMNHLFLNNINTSCYVVGGVFSLTPLF